MSVCKLCFNEINKSGINSYRKDLCICQKCFNEFEPKFYHFKVGKTKALAIYNYDEKIRSELFQLKGCYDIELAPVFLNRFIPELRMIYKGFFVVPFPSGKKDDEVRGFNHVKEIFKFLKLPYIHALKKKVDFKQSSLSKEERTKIISKLELVEQETLKGKRILIVDDVMTTGSSMKAAIELISKCQVKEIKILLLSRNYGKESKNTSFYAKIKQKMRIFDNK